MEKKIELKPGDTIVGLFKKMKQPGDILHVKDEKRDRYQSIRQEALRTRRTKRAKEFDIEPLLI